MQSHTLFVPQLNSAHFTAALQLFSLHACWLPALIPIASLVTPPLNLTCVFASIQYICILSTCLELYLPVDLQVDELDLAGLGPKCETNSVFPAKTNTEFVEVRTKKLKHHTPSQ